MEKALEEQEIVMETFSPADGVRVAFIVHNGSNVNFIKVKE